VDGTGSASCSMTSFGIISGVEPLGSAMRVLIQRAYRCLKINREFKLTALFNPFHSGFYLKKVLILSRLNPVHKFPPYLPKICSNIIYGDKGSRKYKLASHFCCIL
jgi:hypothetical protein